MARFVFFALISGFCSAQEYPRFPFSVGGGLTQTMSGTGSRLDSGWNAGIATGINFHQNFGVMLELTQNSLGVNQNVLRPLGFSQGNVTIRSLTVNPIIHLNPKGRVDVYLIGGGGLYYRRQRFYEPAAPSFIASDPYFGTVSQGNGVDSVFKPGINAGLGMSFGAKWHTKVYVEARYHRMFIRGRRTDLLPITIGFRF